MWICIAPIVIKFHPVDTNVSGASRQPSGLAVGFRSQIFGAVRQDAESDGVRYTAHRYMTYGIFILRGNQWRQLRTCDSLSDAKQELDRLVTRGIRAKIFR